MPLPLDVPPDLLILGASARAAAQSALRAGMQPCCIDQFADLDLRQLSPAMRASRYPQSLPRDARAFPGIPFMFTGALENHPRLVAKLAARQPLWGVAAPQLRAVRNPWKLQAALRAAGLPYLEIWPRDRGTPPADGGWIVKPLRGAAGRGVSVWNEPAACATQPAARHYFQRRAAGEPASAVCAALPGQTTVVGLSRQLVGIREVGATAFQWCGNIAPLHVAPAAQAIIERMARVIADRFGLRGLFGLDFLLEEGIPWLTEVNPRYTASVEVVERVMGLPLLEWHRRAFEPIPGSDWRARAALSQEARFLAPAPGSAAFCGKAVLYAGFDAVMGDTRRLLAGGEDHEPGLAADLPAPGERVAQGHPVCTVFAQGPTTDCCRRQLLERGAMIRSEFMVAAG